MTDDLNTRIGRALGRIPQSLYIMTSQFEDHARGVMVSWVQQAGFSPPMVMVALAKGRSIVPLIHDSHAFAVCQIAERDRVTMKRFIKGGEAGESAFEGIEMRRGVTGSPILTKALAYVDCELVRHIDVEGDHDIYIGRVRDGGPLHDEQVYVHLRENGLKY